MRNFFSGLGFLTLLVAGCAGGEMGGVTAPPDALPAFTAGGTGGAAPAGTGGTGGSGGASAAGGSGGSSAGGSGGAPAPGPDAGAPGPDPVAGQPDAQAMPPAPSPDAQAAYPACTSDRTIYEVHLCYSTVGVPQLLYKDSYVCSICATQDPGVVEQTFSECTLHATTTPSGQPQGIFCVASCDECKLPRTTP